MIEIKLSKKWCNRTVQALSLPFKPLILFHEFLVDKVANGDRYDLSVLFIELQIMTTLVGTLGLYVAFIEPVIQLAAVVVNILVILMIPIGIVGTYLINTISNNISISCRCDEE
ncbi:MAG: hypothetical protein CMC98_02915 [Flavobacteriales bacterium]|nr:hypothetical protein [Flavobacteriales bacterium]|tara:strand:- start:805 stop:1146 length:342 start_codon:yes stop_codon:yes gene_type:complete